MAKAFEQIWKSITGVPAASLSGKRYTFVNFDSAGKIVTATAAGAAIGVAYEPNDVDQPTQVVASGIAFIQLGGTITPGQEVEVGASGKAVVLASGRSAGICVVGGASGAIGSILLK